MKEMMLDKLKKVADLEQRKLLKEILTGFFANLIDYQEGANRSLENRVFNEVVDDSAKYDLFFTVCSRQNIDPLESFLHPVFQDETKEKKFVMRELVAQLKKKEAVFLCSLFMKCDYLTIKKLLATKKAFNGELVTDKNRYAIRVTLEQNRSYLEQTEQLYTVFQRNAMPWKTLNHPYANRFFNAMISECEVIPGEDESVSEIIFDLEEFDAYKRLDHILFWNVERSTIGGSGFPMPALDHVNFQHELSLKKLGTQNGYLIDDDPAYIRYIQRSEEELTVVSPFEKVDQWHLLKITQPEASIGSQYEYEPVSNRRLDSFINKFAQKQTALLRTQAEIFRLVNSFEISKYFELKSIEICDHKGDSVVTYDLNYFLTDDIRVANDKKIMKLKFAILENPHDFIRYDLLSFLVSEVQMYFPDYECVGEVG